MDISLKISYLITCSNETQSLRNLLDRVYDNIDPEDEITIVLDSDCKDNQETRKILENHRDIQWPYVEHSLNNNYSEHKNWGARLCKHEWIFQIDGDELPTEILLVNLKDIIQSNADIEAFWVSRINDFRGVSSEHAKQWGWKLSTSPTYDRPIVNWPDPQCRVFRNVPDRIKWVGRLHERIEGNRNFVYLPFDEDLALYHDKTIERQVETNLRYNQKFTEKENKGFNLPK